MKFYITSTIIMLLNTAIFAQKNKTEITVAFYNCENFFDIVDNPKINDEEYLPKSPLKWNEEKYQNKITKTAQVFDSTVAGEKIPAIMGLCEIENKNVLTDLINKSQLLNKNYKCIVSTGKDLRGINVGLIYDESIFQLVSSEELDATGTYEQLTRNILYAQLKHTTGDVLHVFVNHWPSRRDGEKETEPRRVYAAQILRNRINDLQKNNPNAKCIVMGDLNDHPNNTSVQTTLQAIANPKIKTDLYNPYFEMDANGLGTSYHDSKWGVLDHIIVSQGLLKTKKGFMFDKKNAFILKKDFVLFKNKKTGEERPNRTYGPNSKYFNGYSDHLCVYITLQLK